MRFFSILFLLMVSVSTMCATAATTEPVDTVRGVVVNAKGKPVKKAEVTTGDVKAVTDGNGFFRLNGVDLNSDVTVTAKNVKAQVNLRGIIYPRIQVDGNVASVSPDNEAIMKLVLRSARKSTKTVGNAIVTGEELMETGYDNLLEAISGKVSGVIVFTDENGDVHAKIRGLNSSGSTHALYIVDGIESSRLDIYNVNDVKQVEVLKESNMYGARGGSGVIVVTLK